MSIPFVDLKAQYASIKSDIDLAIAGVINNTSFIGGPIVTEFEEAFADYLGIDHCVGCANGTDAIEIALQALGVGAGDEVIVPANSWISTAEAVNAVGAEPVFVDYLENEYTLDPALTELAITNKTKAIIPVHLYGLPARMPELLKVAQTHQLKIVEDCAQAHGARIADQKVGTFGDIATFSFYPGKNLGAYGDAGGIVTSDRLLAQRCRMIGNHGQLSKHDHRILGRNSRLDTLQAAILKAKLPFLEQWVRQRNQVAQWYGQYLNKSVTRQITPDGYRHVYHLYVIRTAKRAHLMNALDKSNIGYSVHYPTPLPFIEAYAYQNKSEEDFPVASKLADEIISLPIFPEMTEKQVQTVAEIVNKFK
ncbi:DegT/DnrJ/EryC1/StrS family aminotransferase [Alteromonas gilva]|uniref:DegT/DnrJ/EryC1/StrS family aminotransferase n=1 Tax=Alteromonas gilva TaxID=2987522 RepID=A0ABT5L3P5_9ALTE|nr:DegT/DnrJ/EryC1/StrS family aminotransferase [Alteromonas gilva]MDC8830482.1 DegT/DnrJ/EryC1/StrS family aminotransferase [Alteromonas gilva]